MISVPSLVVRRSDAAPPIGPVVTDDPDVEVWRTPAGRVWGCAALVEGRCVVRVQGTGTYLFSPGGATVEVWVDGPCDRQQVEDTYQRLVLPFAVQAGDREVLHASAVRAGNGVLVICGDRGAGKSTLAHALSLRGLRPWADDAVAVSIHGGAPTTEPLPFRLRLRPDAARHFDVGERGAGLKTIVHTVRRPRYERLPVLALVHLDRRGSPDGERLRKVPPAAAFRLLLEQAHCFRAQTPERKTLMVKRYLAMASRLATYRLRVGADLARLREEVADLLLVLRAADEQDAITAPKASPENRRRPPRRSDPCRSA